jgi:hypothetical protein
MTSEVEKERRERFYRSNVLANFSELDDTMNLIKEELVQIKQGISSIANTLESNLKILIQVIRHNQ